MNIKTCLSAIVITLLSLNAFSQEKEIRSGFNDYINTIISGDYEKSVNFIAEEFFEIVPKEQMVLLMEKTFNNPEMEFEMKDVKILDVGEVAEINGKYYAPLTHSNIIRMKFLNSDEEEETEDQYKLRMTLTKQSFDQMFGAGNVKYEEETGFYEIYAEKQVYAISKNGQTGWKFIVIEKQQIPILKKVLPKQILDNI